MIKPFTNKLRNISMSIRVNMQTLGSLYDGGQKVLDIAFRNGSIETSTNASKKRTLNSVLSSEETPKQKRGGSRNKDTRPRWAASAPVACSVPIGTQRERQKSGTLARGRGQCHKWLRKSTKHAKILRKIFGKFITDVNLKICLPVLERKVRKDSLRT